MLIHHASCHLVLGKTLQHVGLATVGRRFGSIGRGVHRVPHGSRVSGLRVRLALGVARRTGVAVVLRIVRAPPEGTAFRPLRLAPRRDADAPGAVAILGDHQIRQVSGRSRPAHRTSLGRLHAGARRSGALPCGDATRNAARDLSRARATNSGKSACSSTAGQPPSARMVRRSASTSCTRAMRTPCVTSRRSSMSPTKEMCGT